jgi:hypothetical protein
MHVEQLWLLASVERVRYDHFVSEERKKARRSICDTTAGSAIAPQDCLSPYQTPSERKCALCGKRRSVRVRRVCEGRGWSAHICSRRGEAGVPTPVLLSSTCTILSKAPESATATYPSNTTNITMSRCVGPYRQEITLLERSASVSKTCSLY